MNGIVKQKYCISWAFPTNSAKKLKGKHFSVTQFQLPVITDHPFSIQQPSPANVTTKLQFWSFSQSQPPLPVLSPISTS